MISTRLKKSSQQSKSEEQHDPHRSTQEAKNDLPQSLQSADAKASKFTEFHRGISLSSGGMVSLVSSASHHDDDYIRQQRIAIRHTYENTHISLFELDPERFPSHAENYRLLDSGECHVFIWNAHSIHKINIFTGAISAAYRMPEVTRLMNRLQLVLAQDKERLFLFAAHEVLILEMRTPKTLAIVARGEMEQHPEATAGNTFLVMPDEQHFMMETKYVDYTLDATNRPQKLDTSQRPGGVNLWEMPTSTEIKTLKCVKRHYLEEKARYTSLLMMPDNKHLIAGEKSGGIMIFDIANLDMPVKIASVKQKGKGEVRALALTPDNRYLVASLDDGHCHFRHQLWDIKSLKKPALLEMIRQDGVSFEIPQTLFVTHNWHVVTNKNVEVSFEDLEAPRRQYLQTMLARKYQFTEESHCSFFCGLGFFQSKKKVSTPEVKQTESPAKSRGG
jgi:hypothetical protein